MTLNDLSPISLPTGFDLTEAVVIDRGARRQLGAIITDYLGKKCFIIADPATAKAAGIQADLLLPDHPHADDPTVEIVRAAADGYSGIVAVGSGTINDLAKRAAAQLTIPYAVLGTASSMNGYASGIAAILSNGLKTTVPCRPARAILLDTDILANAPARLTQAGLGDLLSKPVSDTDWWLADQIEGSGYSTLPGQITDHAVADASAHAAGLATQDPTAHAALGKALVLSGVAMVVAGSSSPASGGEHLLSHLWDMEAHVAGHETRLHGAQVGVASCITAALYQHLIALKTPHFTEPPSWADEEARIRATHGALAAVVLPQAKKKHARAIARVAVLRDRWPQIRDALAARDLPTAAQVRAPLAAAGAPNTLAALNEDRANAARVFRLARDIRDRVTVLDCAFELGVLPNGIDEVLNTAGV